MEETNYLLSSSPEHEFLTLTFLYHNIIAQYLFTLILFTDNGNKRAARAMWKLHVFPVGSDPEKNLHQLELQHLLERGCAMNIQVMAEMRKKDRKLKRNRNDFPATTFSFEETENDALKKRAKKQYSEFLDTLDLDSLKNEVETPCFGKKIEDITVNSLTGKEN